MPPVISAREKICTGVIAVVCWAGLLLQVYLSLFVPYDPSVSLLARSIRFFSYFTVLANLLVAVSLTLYRLFPASAAGRFFSGASVRSAIGVYIFVVGVVYSLLLRQTWDPKGLPGVADHILHDAVPVFYTLYWFVFVPKGSLSWKRPFIWLIFPSSYLAYGLIHGALTGWYPYYFANASVLGYPAALLNSFLVILGFLIVGSVAFGIDKLMRKTAKPPEN